MAAHDRDRAEFSHRPRWVAENDAVNETPFDVGQGYPPENLPASPAPERYRREFFAGSLPCACIRGMSSRATKGKVTKAVASTIPGTAKMTRILCSINQGPNQPCPPKTRT